LCAVAGGAALGAWLGLHAGAGLFSAVTAAVGASLGANLAVLIRDVVAGTSAPADEATPHEASAEPVPAM
jgi:hypothetical protein